MLLDDIQNPEIYHLKDLLIMFLFQESRIYFKEIQYFTGRGLCYFNLKDKK